MNAALVALVLAVTAPLRLSVTILGPQIRAPAGALIWLAVRVLRGFRSSPWPRPCGPVRRAS